MGQVKGSMLVEFVKSIRADKSGVYDKYFTDEERKTISGRILPVLWYPYDFYRKCFQAVFEVAADSDMATAHQWGLIYGEAIVSSTYDGILKTGGPMAALKSYESYFQHFYDFGQVKVEKVADNEALVIFKDFDPDFEPIYHLIQGWLEQTINLCGGENFKVDFEAKVWEGDPETRYRAIWKA